MVPIFLLRTNRFLLRLYKYGQQRGGATKALRVTKSIFFQKTRAAFDGGSHVLSKDVPKVHGIRGKLARYLAGSKKQRVILPLLRTDRFFLR